MANTASRNAKGAAGVREERLGLHRQAMVGAGPAKTVQNLFSDLRLISRGEFIGEDVQRHLQGARVLIDRTEGHGTYELYRLDQDLYVIAADSTYDSPRFETVPGEGLVEFHLRVSGVLEMTLPGRFEPLVATGPSLLILYQPEGVDASECVLPKHRDVGVSLFCKPEYLADLLRRNSIARWSMLEEIEAHRGSNTVWHRLLPLSPGLLYVAKSLLQSRYRRGIRLLHAEAKSLELLCEVLSTADTDAADDAPAVTDTEIRQLETARQMLLTGFSTPSRIADIARTVGMSESKLKRSFKARYGTTVFGFGLDCRMRHALHLLRARRMSVDQVAHEVGYRHQTSFSAAFREHFGFLPRSARNEMQC
jgi:AraC-like DNA-binding protein